MNEKEIIKRCQNGDKAAFDALIRTFYTIEYVEFVLEQYQKIT